MTARVYDPRVIEVCHYELRGLHVRNLVNSCCHTADPSDPEGMRHISVPEGSLGTLTGEVVAFVYELYSKFIGESAGLSYDEYVRIILDPELLRQYMRDVPEYRVFKANSGYAPYWDSVKQLSGPALVAAHTSLTIAWDDLPPETLEGGHYIPWFELIS